MAIKSGLFNSVNKDRVYKAEDFAGYFATFISNGVFPNPSTGLQVIANGNMNVVIRAGKAWIFGYYMTNDADYSLKVDVADGVLNRIDRVVLRLDYASRSIYPTIKKGTFVSNPVPPTLQRDADAYEIALADIAVNKGILSIAQANITDLRLNKDLCGIVHGLIDQVDTTTIFNQYQSWYQQYTKTKSTEFDNWQSDQEADFLTWSNERRTEFEGWSATQQADFLNWFESIKDILDGDVAGNLTNRITQLEQEFDRHKADYASHVEYAIATGSANVYAVSLTPAPNSYVEGMAVTVKINVQNTGASTLNINGLGAKTIKKSNGNDVQSGNLKAGIPYTMRYNGTNFILQGEGGSGNATASDLLSGKTASVDAGDITGSMPNNGAVTITPGTTNQAIVAGYHNGLGIVQGSANLVPSNIKEGINLFNITGTLKEGAVLKSIQSGQARLSSKELEVSISTVDMSKSFLIVKTRTFYSGSSVIGTFVRGQIITSTKLKFDVSSFIGTTIVEWTVVEFASGVQVQAINAGISNSNYGNTTISIPKAVNRNRSFLLMSYLGDMDFVASNAMVTAVFTSDTQINLYREGNWGNIDATIFVVEFL